MDVEEVDVQALTPEILWRDYVSTRKPVLIKGVLQDSSWKAGENWTMEYLSMKAGDCMVKVEMKDTQAGRFGCGRRITMPFEEFLSKVSSGDEGLYLSPQEASEGLDGVPDVISDPLTHLKEDFPLRPQLMGHLIPHQVNVWIGAAREGASSGLHHDYHDNLYVLIKGKKRFKLYNPLQAENMYTVGKIVEVHKNGRIVYEGQPPTMSDGCTVEDFASFEKMNEARAALAEAEDAQDERAIAVAEANFDALIEESLDKAFDEANCESPGEDSLSCEDEQSLDDENQSNVHPKEMAVQVDETEPLNFSKVNLKHPMTAITKQFPKFPADGPCQECVVEEGCMLYLPAGWFHEVTSSNAGEKCAAHIAQNYWFHPPDNLDSKNGFDNPYLSDYWSMKWESKSDFSEESPMGSSDELLSTDLANEVIEIDSKSSPLSDKNISLGDEDGSTSIHKKKKQKLGIL